MEGATYTVDALQCVYRLTILASLQVYMIEAVLAIEPVYHTALYWLHYYYRTIEVCLLVHIPNNPVYECAQEVTLAKLNDLFGHYALGSKMFV